MSGTPSPAHARVTGVDGQSDFPVPFTTSARGRDHASFCSARRDFFRTPRRSNSAPADPARRQRINHHSGRPEFLGNIGLAMGDPVSPRASLVRKPKGSTSRAQRAHGRHRDHKNRQVIDPHHRTRVQRSKLASSSPTAIRRIQQEHGRRRRLVLDTNFYARQSVGDGCLYRSFFFRGHDDALGLTINYPNEPWGGDPFQHSSARLPLVRSHCARTMTAISAPRPQSRVFASWNC